MRQWFYAQHGQQRGPIPDDNLVELYQSGQLSPDTLVWTEGLEEWTVLSEVKNLLPSSLLLPQIPAATPPALAQCTATEVNPPIFLHIPIGRLVFMSIISAGLYNYYWIYKNWRYVKERDGLKIHPFWRGVFGIFFVYGILKTIRNDEQTNHLEQATFSAGGIATGWIIFCLFSGGLAKYENIGANLLSNLLLYTAFCFFIPVQNYINRVNEKMNPKPAYTPWTVGHIVILVLGIVSWLLIVAAIMLPE